MSVTLLLTQKALTKSNIYRRLTSIWILNMNESVVNMNPIQSMENLMISGGIDESYWNALERSGNLKEYIEAVLSKVKWNNRTKRTTLNKLIIANIQSFLDKHVERDVTGRPTIRKNAVGGIYYAKIATYFYDCKKNAVEIVGLFCYCCEKLILIGESCISGSKGTGKKYYHIKCALLKGVV